MKQTTKSIVGVLGLLLVALAVAFGAAWAGRDEEQKAQAKEKHDKLFDFDKNHAVAISLARPGTLVMVERPDAKSPWTMTQPAESGADEAAVNALLNAFVILKQKQDLGNDRDAKTYGLDPSPFIAKVMFDDGKEEGLEFGVANPFDKAVYVRKLGDPTIRIIDEWQKIPFDKNPYDLRNKKVAELPETAEIKRIEVSGIRKPYVLEKDATGWKVSGAPADAPTVDRIVTSFKNLRATAVAAEDYKLALKGEFGMDPPKAIAKVTAVDGQKTITRTILFSTPRPGAVENQFLSYARRDDEKPVFQIDDLFANDLDKDPAELADKQLVHVSPDAVRKLVFEGPSGRVEVTHTQTAATPDGGAASDLYTVVLPQPGPAQKVKLSGALYSLTNLHATRFEGPLPKKLAKYGLDKPMTATLLGDGDKVLARVRVGGLKEDKRYVVVDGVDKLALVEKNVVENLPWTVKDALEIAAK
jgi:uncharacterized protein DUF4340